MQKKKKKKVGKCDTEQTSIRKRPTDSQEVVNSRKAHIRYLNISNI